MLKSGEFWRGIFGNRNIARIILRFIYLLFFRRYEFTSVKKTDYFKGILYNCVMTVESLMNIITSIKPGITEVICHPAYDEAEYKKLNHYKYMKNYKRERELKSLCNPDIYKLVEKYDIKITSYKDLTQ